MSHWEAEMFIQCPSGAVIRTMKVLDQDKWHSLLQSLALCCCCCRSQVSPETTWQPSGQVVCMESHDNRCTCFEHNWQKHLTSCLWHLLPNPWPWPDRSWPLSVCRTHHSFPSSLCSHSEARNSWRSDTKVRKVVVLVVVCGFYSSFACVLYFFFRKCCKTSTAGLWSYRTVCVSIVTNTLSRLHRVLEKIQEEMTIEIPEETTNQNLTQFVCLLVWVWSQCVSIGWIRWNIQSHKVCKKRCVLNDLSRLWNWHPRVKSRQSKLPNTVAVYFFLIHHMFSDAPAFFYTGV